MSLEQAFDLLAPWFAMDAWRVGNLPGGLFYPEDGSFRAPGFGMVWRWGYRGRPRSGEVDEMFGVLRGARIYPQRATVDEALGLMVKPLNGFRVARAEVFYQPKEVFGALVAARKQFGDQATEQTPIDLDLNMDWLREHGEEYRGRWVALNAGMLLEVSSTLKDMTKRLGRRARLATVLCVDHFYAGA